MELFSLFGKIGIKNQEANKAIDDTTGRAETSGKKITNVFGTIGNVAVKAGKAMAVGLATGTAALATLTGVVVKNYAEYEQLKGGVETLFGAGGQSLEQYAQSVGKSVDEAKGKYDQLMAAQTEVMNNSKASFKTTGLSANEYMETITGFSASLIQSLGGDTKKAAQVGNQAVVDMSDNANKMGTSMELIQNAYQGFAKQNYTMLDNLKLGYGGTKEEMQRLLNDAEKISGIHYNIDSFADVTQAIHVMQESMGIAGTTMKEAEKTISGSIGMLKASWTDLLTGMADPGQDIAKLVNNVTYSFGKVLDNVVPRIKEALPRIIEGLTQLFLQISAYLPGLLQAVLPALISGGTQLLGALFSVLPAIFYTLFNTILPEVAKTFVSFMDSVFSQVPSEFSGLRKAYENIKQIISNVGGIVSEFFKGFSEADASKSKLEDLKGVLSTVTDFLGDATGKVKDFTDWFKKGGAGVDTLKSAVVGVTTAWAAYKVVTGVIKGIETARNVVLGISNGLMIARFVQTGALTAAEGAHAAATVAGTGAMAAFNAVMAVNPFVIIIAAIAALVAGLIWFFTQTETGKQIWSSFVTFLTDLWNGIVTNAPLIWQAIVDFFVNLWNGISSTAMAVWNGIAGFFVGLWNGILATATGIFSGIVSFFSGVWQSISGTASSVWSGIVSFLSGLWNGISSTASSIFNGIKNTISNVFNSIKSTTSSIWNGVKSTISNAIDGAKNAVKSAIDAIKGFFNFKVSWPHIPLPHFKASGSANPLDWVKGKGIPSIGIDWYAKGGIMTSPTLFGINGNRAMVGGEAGDEAILPLNDQTLAGIGRGISEASGETESLDVLYQILAVLQEILDKDPNIVLDDDTLISKTWKKYKDKIDAANARRLRLQGGS